MFYLLLFGLFVVQEPISSNVGLLEAYQLHYNLWLVTALFLLATVIDILVGYAIGIWAERRWPVFFETQVLSRARSTMNLAGRYGEYLFLIIIGPMLFPYSALLAPLLGIPLRKALPLMLLSDLILWYGSEWLIVLGVKTAIPNPLWALGAVVLVTALLTLVLKWFERRRRG